MSEDDASLFIQYLHPSIIKSNEEKKAIFANMMDNYEIKGKKLARNYIFKLDLLGPDPLVVCRDHQVRGVTGPHEQWAIELSTTNAGEQARIFMLFATVPQALQKGSKLKVGLVHLNTQNWSFNKKTPEALFDEAKKWSLLSEPLAAWAYGTAAKKIVHSNAYFFDTRYQTKLADLEIWTRDMEKFTATFPNTKVPETELTLRAFTTVYKSDSVQVGAKLVADKEIPVNTHIESCKAVARYLAPLFKGIKASFDGIECLLYRNDEPIEGIPRAGSVFTSFVEALSAPTSKKL